jgi:hypothetical protein
MKLQVTKGATSVSLLLWIQDSASLVGAGKTGLAYNTASLVAYYARPRSAATSITLATQTVTGSYSSGGFVEIDATNMPGWYRLDIPNAALASGVDSVGVHLKGASGMAPLPLEIQLIACDLQSATDLGLSNLNAAITTRLASASYTAPDSASTIAAAVWAAGTRTLSSYGTLVADIWAATTRTLSAFAFSVTASSVTDKTGYSLSTAPPTAAEIRTEIDSNSTAIAAVKTKTDQLSFTGSDVKATLDGESVTASTVSDKTGYSLTSGERTSIAEALLKLDLSTVTGEAGRSVLNAIRFLRNKWSISGTTLTVTKEDDSTSAWTSTLTTSGSADPITGTDPS